MLDKTAYIRILSTQHIQNIHLCVYFVVYVKILSNFTKDADYSGAPQNEAAPALFFSL